MGENTTPKRTYQKHKTGYKIAVEYKLNKKLKPEIFQHEEEEVNLYPLYIEVRAKGKVTFFRSRLQIKFSDKKFEEFLNSSAGNLFINEEKSRIIKSVSNFFLQNQAYSLSEWFETYSYEIYSNTISNYTNKILAKQITKLVEQEATNEYDKMLYTFLNEQLQLDYQNYSNVIELFAFLGLVKIKNLITIIKLKNSIIDSFMLLSLDFSVFGNILYFITIQDINSGFCEKMINNYYQYIEECTFEGITQKGEVIKTTYISRAEVIDNINNFKREIEKLDVQ